MFKIFMLLSLAGFSGLSPQLVRAAEPGLPMLQNPQQTDISDLLSSSYFRMRLLPSILDSVRVHAAEGIGLVQIPSAAEMGSDFRIAITHDAAYTFFGMLTDKEREQFKNRLVEVRRDFVEYDSGMKDLSFGDEDEIILEFGFNFSSFESTSSLLNRGLFSDPLKAFVAYSEREIAGEVWSFDFTNAGESARKRHIRESSCIPEKLRSFFRHIKYAPVQN